MKKANFLFFTILSIFLLVSCASVKKSQLDFLMFQRGLDSMGKVNAEEVLIKPSDNLDILFYTQATANQDQTALYNSNSKNGYKVDILGNITIPGLGNVKAIGMTPKELAIDLEKRVTLTIKNPMVTVNLKSVKVYALGQFKKPGIVELPADDPTLLNLIASNSGVSETGDYRKVLIIREDSLKQRVPIYIDMTSGAFLASDKFQLKQNDIIYINPSRNALKEYAIRSQIIETQRIQPLLVYISAFTSVISLYLIVKTIK
ncbi:MAG: polysaccharide biosynthesis/export family protein [Bacteroidetes bacterium]|nr:polysaccharide biosynthesis/export family protein [Bacteroidota bacterium]